MCDLCLEGDCSLGFDGDEGGVTKAVPGPEGPTFTGDRDCGGELDCIRKAK